MAAGNVIKDALHGTTVTDLLYVTGKFAFTNRKAAAHDNMMLTIVLMPTKKRQRNKIKWHKSSRLIFMRQSKPSDSKAYSSMSLADG
jgi:hypothetical protein